MIAKEMMNIDLHHEKQGLEDKLQVIGIVYVHAADRIVAKASAYVLLIFDS